MDELFLFWLSEPSTQDMLRSELSRVCSARTSSSGSSSAGSSSASSRLCPLDECELSPAAPSSQHATPTCSVTSIRRPESPVLRSPSPPSASLSPSHAHAANSHSSRSSPSSSSSSSPRSSKAAKGTARPKKTLWKSVTSSSLEEVDSPSAVPPSARVLRRAASESQIPRFYFPNGKPRCEENVSNALERAKAIVFDKFPRCEVPQHEFEGVVKALGLPGYWKAPLIKACVGKTSKVVSYHTLKKVWQNVTFSCHDNAARFVSLLASNGRSYLTEDDFDVLVQDVVDRHPGLSFLQSAPEFHARYVETVIGRIFYCLDRNWSSKITAADLRRSNFLQTLVLLEEEDDINQVTDYFSYEHFYVIYCKFWELDTDHDLIIDAEDLAKHSDHALTAKVVQRIMSGVVTRNKSTPLGKLSYQDFVWFLLSEEDKTTVKSVEYWFRCLDLDGDGALSLYEIEHFYDEVCDRLQEMSVECLSKVNTICQVLDMINPREPDKITLQDLKRSKMTPIFLNTLVNVDKYLEYEQRDVVATATSKEENELVSMSDWDKYAAEQYDILLAEEEYGQENDFEEEEVGESDLEQEEEMLALLR